MPNANIAQPTSGAPIDRLSTVADQIAAFGASASGDWFSANYQFAGE